MTPTHDPSATPPTAPNRSRPPRLLRRGSWADVNYVRDVLRKETVGGALLLAAAVVALLWANSPWREAYSSLRDFTIGPESLHLNLSLGTWAADGLLAIFFLAAGIELKREFVAGDLADRSRAAVPIVAAVCGVALPAIIFVLVVKGMGGDADALAGWAIPTATDIAFALAVLAVIGTNLPSALRSFLLTLAVVDDLIAITIIAIFYSSNLHLGWLAVAIVPLVVWRLLLRKRITNPLILAVPALFAWYAVHSAGVHATVAGVALGLLVPVSKAVEDDPNRRSLAERFERRVRPFSAGVAVPIFAFFAAGVTVIGGGFGEALSDPVLVGVILGLVLGKTIGVFGGTYVLARFTRAELDDDIAWTDLFGLALLSGVGFTVSLLVGELAFGSGSPRDDHVKLAVLLGSLLAAVFATIVLRRRNRHYAEVQRREELDADDDGIPDAFQAQ